MKFRPCGSPYLICALVFTLACSSIQLVQWANGIAGIHARCPPIFFHNQSETVESTFLNTKNCLIYMYSFTCSSWQLLVSLYCSKFLQYGLCCLRPLFLNCYLAQKKALIANCLLRLLIDLEFKWQHIYFKGSNSNGKGKVYTFSSNNYYLLFLIILIIIIKGGNFIL